MTLKIAASVTLAQTAAGLIFSFLSIKVTSVYLGPAGLGAMGQLAYFMSLTQAILASGVGTGLTKRMAELGPDEGGRSIIISTVLRSLIWLGIPVALLIALGSFWIARDFLNDERIRVPLLVFSIILVLGLMANTITSSAYGAKDFVGIAVINISTGAVSLLMMILLAPQFGLNGALFATAILPLVTFTIAWFTARRRAWWPKRPMSYGFSRSELRSVTSFVPLAIISSVGAPLLQLLIREEVVSSSGMTSVGLLQGVMKISDMYVGLAGGILSMYFFPRFCESRNREEYLVEIGKALLFVGVVGSLLSLFIYLLREEIVHIIFTRDFLPMVDLFGWQMIGNTLRLLAWPLAFALLAKANSIVYAGFELMVLFVLWFTSYYLVDKYGVVGVPRAYVLTYIAYLLIATLGIYRVCINIPVAVND